MKNFSLKTYLLQAFQKFARNHHQNPKIYSLNLVI